MATCSKEKDEKGWLSSKSIRSHLTNSWPAQSLRKLGNSTMCHLSEELKPIISPPLKQSALIFSLDSLTATNKLIEYLWQLAIPISKLKSVALSQDRSHCSVCSKGAMVDSYFDCSRTKRSAQSRLQEGLKKLCALFCNVSCVHGLRVKAIVEGYLDRELTNFKNMEGTSSLNNGIESAILDDVLEPLNIKDYTMEEYLPLYNHVDLLGSIFLREKFDFYAIPISIYSDRRQGLLFPKYNSVSSLDQQSQKLQSRTRHSISFLPETTPYLQPQSEGSRTAFSSFQTSTFWYTMQHSSSAGFKIPGSTLKEFQATSTAARPIYWNYKLYMNSQGEIPACTVSTDKATAEALAQLFVGKPVVGFDTEWKVAGRQG